MTNKFHLAIPVHNLKIAEEFYVTKLNCTTGRKTKEWCDLNFFGHQLTLHLKPEETNIISTNNVEECAVPVRHFGIILTMNDWDDLAKKLAAAKTSFIIRPHIRFKGQTGEQATMFFLDPSSNALEFKAFADQSQVFAAYID